MSNPEGINQYTGGGKSSPDDVQFRFGKGQRDSAIDARLTAVRLKRRDAYEKTNGGKAGDRASARYERVQEIERSYSRFSSAFRPDDQGVVNLQPASPGTGD